MAKSQKHHQPPPRVMESKMKIKYDPKAEVVYICLSDAVPYFGIVDYTQELTENVLVDWLKDGTIYGISITSIKSEPIVEKDE